MYTIEIEDECACFKKSSHTNNMTFDSREDMINKARVLECLMNQQFCMTHYFDAVDYGEKIIIHKSMRPTDEDDEDTEDAGDLIRKSPIVIGFDGSQVPPGESGSN